MNVPEELTTGLRAAAAAVPPHPGDLPGVRRRGQTRLRHRAVTGAGLVAVAVAAAVGVPFALGGAGAGAEGVADPVAAPFDPGAPPPAGPVQRLLADGTGWVSTRDPTPPDGLTARETYEWYQDEPGAQGVLGPPVEIAPDGTVVPLLVVAPDGSVRSSRDVRVHCQTVDLIAVDAGTAYLARGTQLVAHDLATGAERRLLDSAEAVPAGRSGLAYRAGRLAAAVSDPDCPGIGGLVVRVTDVATGDSRDHAPPGEGCQRHAGPVRLSPDGRYAAVAYHSFPTETAGELRVAVLDLAGGGVVAQRLVGRAAGPDLAGDTAPGRAGIGTAAVVGLAWHDPQTLRLAWYDLPPEGVHWLPDVVQVSEVPVRG